MRIAEQEIPETPRMLVFDKITPTLKHAEVQIESMTEAVAEMVSEWDIRDAEHESPSARSDDWTTFNVLLGGTVDLLAYNPLNQETVIVDLKTAADYAPAWLQLGGYAFLHEMETGWPVETVATIYFPIKLSSDRHYPGGLSYRLNRFG